MDSGKRWWHGLIHSVGDDIQCWVCQVGRVSTISLIKELRYKDYVMNFDTDKWKTAPELKMRLNDIREGRAEDTHGWMFRV